MAKIFVSYSRGDRQFVDEFVPLLRRVYGNDSVWFDDDLTGGTDWWKMILAEISRCDLFVYLISNDALESPYCQDEFREALNQCKHVLPVIVRPRTIYPGRAPRDLQKVLKRIQYVDMSKGFKDHTAIAQLIAAVRQLLERDKPATPITLEPVLEPPPVDDSQLKKRPAVRAIILASVAIALLTALIIFVVLKPFSGNGNSPTTSPTEIASVTDIEQIMPDMAELDLSSPPFTPNTFIGQTRDLDELVALLESAGRTTLASITQTTGEQDGLVAQVVRAWDTGSTCPVESESIYEFQVLVIVFEDDLGARSHLYRPELYNAQIESGTFEEFRLEEDDGVFATGVPLGQTCENARVYTKLIPYGRFLLATMVSVSPESDENAIVAMLDRTNAFLKLRIENAHLG